MTPRDPGPSFSPSSIVALQGQCKDKDLLYLPEKKGHSDCENVIVVSRNVAY